MRFAGNDAAVVGLLAGLMGAVAGAGAVAAADWHDDRAPAVAGPQVATLYRTPSASAIPAGAAVPATGIPAIAAAVLPSVVTISAHGATSDGTGSGVVLDNEGYILTNNHVVADAVAAGSKGTLSVIVTGGTAATGVPATVVGTDPLTDLAVIRTAPSPALRPATLGHSASLQIGDTVLAVGAPLGLDGTVTEGIVSATNRFFTVGGDRCSAGTDYTGAIQTDAAINPGNSGGALVDARGAVVGINAAIATAGGGASSSDQSGNIGVGFAIPIDEAAPTAEEIIRTGKATHPFLGVSTTDSGSPVGAKVASQQDPCSGSLVQGVSTGSPAAKAGLRDGDVITALAGKPLGGTDDLVTAIRLLKVGDTVGVTYVRGGTTRTASVTLVERPASGG